MLNLRRIRPNEDRGAVAVIVVLLFASLVVFGMGALAVDTGQFYAEKAQLQNGADSAALAVAKGCAKASCDTSKAATSTAGTFTTLNSNHHAAEVEILCGSVTSGCSGANAQNLCPADPTNTNVKWVDVQTQTHTASADHALPAAFGQAVLGDKYNGIIHACAQAQWGPIGGGTGLALTMSLCAWQDAVRKSDGTEQYATPAPPYRDNAWPPAYPFGNVTKKNPVKPNVGGENVVQIHGDAKPCNDSSSGQNIEGGFGWLQDAGSCQAKTTADGYVTSDPGTDITNSCKDALAAIYNASTGTQRIPNASNPIYIPIFDKACDSNGDLIPSGAACPTGMPNSSYHIAGYATFVLTGYDFNAVGANSLITTKNGVCKGSFKCLYGLFTNNLVATTGDICAVTNCGDFGAPVVVKLTG